MTRQTHHLALTLTALAAIALLLHEGRRNLPITRASLPGQYTFTTPRADNATEDCLTLTPDGRFYGPGLHALDDTAPTSGRWLLVTRGRRTFLLLGHGEFPVSHHLFGAPTLTLGPVPGVNDCTRR